MITRNETNADREWVKSAIRNRHDILYYKYTEKHIFVKKIKGDFPDTAILEHDQYYKNYLMKASNDLITRYPDESDLSYKRDYHLIKDADSIYFSGYFDLTPRLQIKGRDGWIVEMFVNKLLKEKVVDFPIYMFSENMKCWCRLSIENEVVKWLYTVRVPRPEGKYLVFGSDPISSTASLEISIL
jgi:hypothetical protein